MARRLSGLPSYVVELEVAAVAIVTVEAASADAACDIAESRVKPKHVTELRETTSLRCVRVGDELGRVMRTRGRRRRERASAEPSSGGPE